MQLSAEASTQNLPIMLFVTSPSCGYCHILERDVIVPMLKNSHYQDKVLLRRLDLGQNQMVDFDGQTKDPMRIAARYKAQLTPTIVFLAPDGKQLQDHILGVVKDVDQYGGMIDSRLNRSLELLGNTLRIDHTR
jgi:thioredoxin-related protein